MLTDFPLFAILSYQTDYFSALCHNKKVSTGLQEILTMDYVYLCNIHVEVFQARPLIGFLRELKHYTTLHLYVYVVWAICIFFTGLYNNIT